MIYLLEGTTAGRSEPSKSVGKGEKMGPSADGQYEKKLFCKACHREGQSK